MADDEDGTNFFKFIPTKDLALFSIDRSTKLTNHSLRLCWIPA